MPTIGETLREARMRQRLDIADVEARTKIRAKYLRALENEEFGLLPGSTFVKTFLRTYAELLGLDAHRLVEEYRANYEPADEFEVQALGTPSAPGRREGRERRRAPGPPSRFAVLVGAIVVILVFLVVLGLTGEEEGGDDGGEEAAQRTGTERQRPARPRPKPKPTPSSVTLLVTPDGPTYVCLDRGPGTDRLFEGTISEPQTFRGRKLRINLGRTSVMLRLNGRDFPVEPEANPVGYEFSTKGSKPLPPPERPCVE
jgi:cytoskeleton protein RodZ